MKYILFFIIVIFTTICFYNSIKIEQFVDIGLEDPFIYKSLNYIKSSRFDPLEYISIMDDFGQYKKYRTEYKYPKNAKYSTQYNTIITKQSLKHNTLYYFRLHKLHHYRLNKIY